MFKVSVLFFFDFGFFLPPFLAFLSDYPILGLSGLELYRLYSGAVRLMRWLTTQLVRVMGFFSVDIANHTPSLRSIGKKSKNSYFSPVGGQWAR